MKRNDVKIIIGVLIVAGVFYLFNQYRISKMDVNKLYVEIKVEGELYERVQLSDEKEIKIERDDSYNIINVHDNGVEMIEANCPDHVCVRTGFINKVGSTIVCLPHKVYVEIVGDVEDGLDAISE